MLSNTNDFEGGELMTFEKDETFKTYSFEQGDMIIFPSHKYHSVNTVTKGERKVLAIELWYGDEGNNHYRTGAFGYLIQDQMTNSF